MLWPCRLSCCGAVTSCKTRSARNRAAAAQGCASAAQMVEKAAADRCCRQDPGGGAAHLRRGPGRARLASVARPGVSCSVVIVGADPGGGLVWLDAGQLQAARQQARDLRQKSQETIARARAASERASRGRSQRQILQESAYARLLASPDIPEATKARLREEHTWLDPFELNPNSEVERDF